MSKTLTLSLNKKLIIEAVKADTYITGAIDKSADGVKNAALAYNEQAGDDTYHERKLTRTLAGAVGSLEADLAEFVDSSVDNSISDTLASADASTGAFNITIIVSDRYNSGLAYPIAQLSQEYIVNKMLYYWWQSIKPALAKDYLSFSGESLVNIRKCLAKKAPDTSSASYEDVTGSISGASSGEEFVVDGKIEADGTTHKYEVGADELVAAYTAYAAHPNLTIDCTQPMGFRVMNGETKLFEFSSTPYRLTDANNTALNSTGENDVEFVPIGTLDYSNVIIYKHTEPAS